MRTVNIKRERLLEKLTHNRDRHNVRYEEAYEAYKSKAIEALGLAFHNAHGNGIIRTNLHFVVPQNHIHEYDKIIQMVEMSVDHVLELDDREFDQYVMDNWEWVSTFNASATTYMGSGTKD